VDGPHYIGRLVVTAGHCLELHDRLDGSQGLPPSHGTSYLEERTYGNLLGSLDAEPSIYGECLFVDPIADIAVVGPPDNQEFGEEAEKYEELVQSQLPIAITDAAREGHAWLLSLENEWFRSSFNYINDGPLLISAPDRPIVGGMSGSPIISETGDAIGVVSLGLSSTGLSLPNVRLYRSLPGWLLQII
jgi:hypothetical protein